MKRKRALQGCNHRRGITWWGLIRADVGSAGESNSNLALPPPSHFSPHRTNRPPHALKILFRFSRALKHPLVGAAPPCALAGFAGQSFPTHRSVGSRHQTGTIFPAECGPVHAVTREESQRACVELVGDRLPQRPSGACRAEEAGLFNNPIPGGTGSCEHGPPRDPASSCRCDPGTRTVLSTVRRTSWAIGMNHVSRNGVKVYLVSQNLTRKITSRRQTPEQSPW